MMYVYMNVCIYIFVCMYVRCMQVCENPTVDRLYIIIIRVNGMYVCM